VNADRVDRVRARVEEAGAESILVTTPVDVRYLTGLASSNAACVVRRDAVVVATDGRYLEAARSVDGVEVVQAERDLLAWLGPRLRDLAPGPVAFQADDVTVAQHEPLRESGVELVPTTGLMRRIRAVKSAEELDRVRASAAVHQAMIRRLAEERLVGRTEIEVAWWIVCTLGEEGADTVAFDPIVGAGPNAAIPHHHPGDRAIGRNETVVVDSGAVLDGYYSDCTRTFATGELPGDLAEAYELCRAAQGRGLEAVRAGASTRAIDAVARREIEGSGLAPILHGLGHGVGLELQELPYLNDSYDAELEPGNVVTVEPGVYLAGKGGVRIEDLVIVTDDGPEVLTGFTKDLVTLS
jgi:Xaa-Pro aminopeptidase